MHVSLQRAIWAVFANIAIFLGGIEAGFSQVSHYETYQTANCTGVTTCHLIFPTVPANQTLTVTRISCGMSYSNGPPRVAYFQFGRRNPAVAVGIDKGSMPFTYLTLTPRSDSSTNNGYAANFELSHVFTAGQIPFLYQSLTSGNFNLFACSIFGTITSNVT
jgi:hypothetical protein